MPYAQVAERNAIRTIFPDAVIRLCYWHAIEALRRYSVLTHSKYSVLTHSKLGCHGR